MEPQEDVGRTLVERSCGERRVLLKARDEGAISRLGFLEGNPRVPSEETLAGRRPHSVYALPDGRRLLWKRCHRGGMVEPLLGDRHWKSERFRREFLITEQARRAGLPVAEIIALAEQPAGGGWQRVEMLTGVVEGARDLAGALADDRISPLTVGRILSAAGTELRRFHALGFLHGDLNLKNILWVSRGNDIDVFLIDLDPGAGMLGAGTPQDNLLRLYRSALKGERRGAWKLRDTDLMRFLDGYYPDDRVARRALWARGRRLRQRQRWLHPRSLAPTMIFREGRRPSQDRP